MGILLILLIVVAILVAVVVAALLLPIDLSIRLVTKGLGAEGTLAFAFLKGAVSGHVDFSSEQQEFRLRVSRFTVLRRPLEKKAAEAEKEAEEEKKKPQEKKLADWTKLVVNANELYAAGTELARAVTSSISVERVQASAEIGLPDPAQTGMLTGFFYAGSSIATVFLPQTRLEFTHSFEEEKLDTDVDVALRLALYKMVLPAIRFYRRTRKLF